MISKENIISYIHEGFAEKSFFVVDINITNNKQIIILIDKNEGININECIEITRYLQDKFGEEIEEYELQVSSPGLGQAFRVIEQYKKNIGKQVEIVKKDGKKIKGKLISVSEENIEIEEEVKLKPKKEIEIKNVKIEFSNIKSTKEVIKIK